MKECVVYVNLNLNKEHMLYFALYTQVSDVKSTYNAPPQLSDSSSSCRSDAKEVKIKSGDIDLFLSSFLSFLL